MSSKKSGQLYPRHRRFRDKSDRRWHVDYILLYDGSEDMWVGYYRTNIGARIAAFWNTQIASWGGSAVLYEKRKGKK